MKKLIVFLFTSLLVLGACGQSEKQTSESKKHESKNNDSKKELKKDKNNNIEKNKNEANKNSNNTKNNSDENETDEKRDTENKEMEKLNFNNVTDRESLKHIIYGNYSESQKVQAYNSAVSNGVIPQGNVMNGPASAAYESSLRVESGQEKSVYDQTQETVNRNNVIDFVEDYEGEPLDTNTYTFKDPEKRDDGSWGFAFYTKNGELAGSYIIDSDGVVTKFNNKGLEE